MYKSVIIENKDQAMAIYDNCLNVWENVDNSNGAKIYFLKQHYCEHLDFPVYLKYNEETNKLSFETSYESMNLNYKETFNGFTFVNKFINNEFIDIKKLK